MQYNIFQNDFYDDAPGVSWAYRLTLILGDPGEQVVVLGKCVAEVNLPEAELKTYTIFHGGVSFDLPVRYKNASSFNVRFNDNRKLTAYKTILSLFRRSYDNRESYADGQRNLKIYKYADQSKNLRIVLDILDPSDINLRDTKPTGTEQTLTGLTTNEMRIVATYTFEDCYFEDIEDVELNYSSEELVEWGVTVEFQSVEVEYPRQRKLVIEDYTDVTEIPSTNYGIDEPAFDVDLSRQQEGYGKFKDGGFGGTGEGGEGAGGDGTGTGLGGTSMYGIGNSKIAISERSSNDGISGGTSDEMFQNVIHEGNGNPGDEEGDTATELKNGTGTGKYDVDSSDYRMAKESIEGFDELPPEEQREIVKNMKKSDVGKIDDKADSVRENLENRGLEAKEVQAKMRSMGYTQETIERSYETKAKEQLEFEGIEATSENIKLRARLEMSGFERGLRFADPLKRKFKSDK